jgi:hypothetical protein
MVSSAVLCCVQYPTTWLHELGHNLYMNHAGSYQDRGSGALQVSTYLLAYLLSKAYSITCMAWAQPSTPPSG